MWLSEWDSRVINQGLLPGALSPHLWLTQSQAALETHALGNSQQSFSSWFDLFVPIVKHFAKLEGRSNICDLRKPWNSRQTLSKPLSPTAPD